MNKNEVRNISQLLGRYGLTAPVSAEMQRRMADDYAPLYRRIVKKAPGAALFGSVIAALFFLVKKMAVPVPLVKAAAAVVLSASVGAGVYLAMSPGLHAPVPAPGAIIRPFASSSLDEKTAVELSRGLARSLDRRFGPGYSSLATGPGIAGAGLAVFGTAEAMGNGMIVIVKVIDPETSRLLCILEERFTSADERDRAFERMAARFPSPAKK
ncbi:MAG TPA: hypothetical protein PK926_12490 [Spirochaetota bacterium]|nr:hypothetical protein [Spirochaetota bacterium]HPI89226.1 hypothetical protein [Spirochaetota bacterium]HPR48957.1 hypothetical protein [Spirochaetota bacterium]